ncbi:SMI1/KNR4 family protein [Streptomyces alboflavus]|uniref:SMI1/KNR4 family protein n=1 Tax=Streptomyces alboflavus TaxID=67267 RepID=UPI001F3306AB|nr:SMI1/KNR4 family protein [Streptomyces alboflavus]
MAGREHPRWDSVAYWRGYLASYSADLLRANEIDASREISDEQRAAGWLGQAGATEEQLVAAEERLGARLPPSYRAFLAASNGFSHLGPFMYEMRTTGTVGWLREADPSTWAIIRQGGPEEAAYMDRVLLISGFGDAQFWLLDPGDVSPAGEWAANIWASWYPGLRERRHSFADLVADERRSFERLRDAD